MATTPAGPCMNPHCYFVRRQGDFFCSPCYHSLPSEIRRELWRKNFREVSLGIQEAKKYFMAQSALKVKNGAIGT